MLLRPGSRGAESIFFRFMITRTVARTMSPPMVVVVGTTGVGKSKLAVELAQSLTGSSSPWRTGCVLNADAMQVYRGLDIITNKIPLEEQNGIQHSLMGFKDPGEQYVVGEWIHDALRVVSPPDPSYNRCNRWY